MRLLLAAVLLACLLLGGCSSSYIPNCTITLVDGTVLHGDAATQSNGRIHIVGEGFGGIWDANLIARIEPDTKGDLQP